MSDVIKLENINKKYGSVNALENINLEIEKGEFISIVGASGSGKTTLMNILGCLDIADSGEYILDGCNINEYTDSEISEVRNQKIGFIFQGFNLISSMTAAENVELPLVYRHISKHKRRKIALEALEKVSLSSRTDHKPSEMSGGQQQRVAIARALASQPEIILADEPTGNLDPKSGSIVMDIIKNLNTCGKTVILITHDMNIAQSASRIIKIYNGKIISDMKSRFLNE